MRSSIDCVHCYLKQAVSCMQHAGTVSGKQYEVIFELMDYIKDFDRNESPAVNSTLALLKAQEIIGSKDPYSKVKRQSNDLAMALYPRLRNIIAKAKDRLYEALKVSVAGNVIDLGINRSFDIEEGLRYSLESGFSLDHYSRFLKPLEKTDKLLFIGDNAGEILFDRLLVEELAARGKQVTYVVKQGPILNDSTMEDAVYTGMDKVARVITSGSNYLGTYLKKISPEFKDLLDNSSLIISKGQANFESLENEASFRGKIFYLLKIKCDEIARVSGSRLGDVVFFSR